MHIFRQQHIANPKVLRLVQGAFLNFLWFGDITYNMHCGLSALPPFAVTRCGAYHPPGEEESRTLLSEGVVGFRLVFSGVYGSDSFVFLRI